MTEEPTRPSDYKWRAMAAVAVGNFLGPLNGSIVNIALPNITAYFDVGLPAAEWVIMAFLLVISSLLLTYGRLGDILGHKPVYVSGFFVFTLGSLLCAFAGSINMLIVYRVVQGLGAGMLMAMGPAILTSAFPARERGKALGLMGMVVAAALASGPVLGGLLVGYFDWRAIFLINVPLGLFGLLWTAYILVWDKGKAKQSFDYAGAITFSAGLTLLLLGLSKGQEWGWSSSLTLGLGLGALVLLAVFVLTETKIPHPMLDLSLFRNRLFTAANASSMLNFMAQFAVYLLMPFYLLDIRHIEPQHAGLLMMASPLVVVIVAPHSGALSDRIGSRLLSSTGMGIIAVGLFLLSRVPVDASLPVIALVLALIGMGVGLFQSPNNSAIMGSVPRHRIGIASGMLATTRNVGMVLGIAVSGAVFAIRHAYHIHNLELSGLSETALTSLSFTSAMNDAFLVGSLLAVVGVLTSLVRGNESSGQKQDTLPKRQRAQEGSRHC